MVELVIDIVGTVLTVTVTLAQAVVLHGPSALTKYVVVAPTVVFSVAPVPTSVPPQLPVYHFQLPDPRLPPVTFKVTAPGPHWLVELAVAPVGAVDGALMVTLVVVVTAPQPAAAARV